MIVPGSANALLLDASTGGYTISRSLRFRSSASAYLNRTPASAGNRTTWTWSAWVKRGSLGSLQGLFGSGNGSTVGTYIQFTSSDQLEIYYYSGAYVWRFITTPVYRDPSAWYNITLVYDASNATAANRLRLYVNNVQITAFGTSSTITINQNTSINSNSYAHYISNTGTLLDGYLAEVNFIDGQALTPSSFGETDATTGVWKPKAYTGTYGTNGFYLKFADNSGATATTIGKDSSGNGNNWTPTNISVTAGTTYDSMIDTPTPYDDGGNGVGNYATLNGVFKDGNTGFTLQDGNLRQNGTGNPCGAAASSIAPSSGKWYCEFSVGSSNYVQVGVIDLNTPIMSASQMTGANKISWDMNSSGPSLFVNSASGTAYTSLTAGDVGMVAYDIASRNVWFGKNGTWFASGNPVNGTNPAGSVSGSSYSLLVAVRAEATWAAFNFGQRPFTYTPPSGFKALNTQNLPTPTIAAGNKYFDISTYTGNGSSISVTNSGSFQPDFVWIKKRSAAANNILFDGLRGVTKYLLSDSTLAEGTDVQTLTAFNSSGFSYGNETSGNANGATFVGWQWNAGGNTIAGTGTGGITNVSYRANQTAGFSVVTYTGSGANGTVTHGLGVAPSMLIGFKRSGTANHPCWHSSFAGTEFILLNSTAAKYTTPTTVFNGAPTSTVFNLGTDTDLNGSGATGVMYCFAAVAGYSAFGSYTGNGSADGTFVYTGFRPRYVMFKKTNSTGDWLVLDTARSPSNVSAAYLQPNTSNIEDSSFNIVDYLSNGFKLRITTDPNISGSTYIYAAFAENPLKYSLAR